MEGLRSPPGRTPPTWLTDLAAWYGGSDEAGRRQVEELVKVVSVSALGRVLAVLDGTMSIEGPGEKGSVLLEYERDEMRVRLNPPDMSLQDLLKEVLWST